MPAEIARRERETVARRDLKVLLPPRWVRVAGPQLRAGMPPP